MSGSEIQAKLKSFILEEFLPDSEPDELENDTPLTSSGILDSIATVKLVTYLEKEFSIEVEAHEMGDLDSLDDITALVVKKRPETAGT